MIPTKQPEYTAHWEGFVPRLYICPAGFPTIGYGHRVGTWSLQDTGSTASGAPTCGRLLRSMIAGDTGDWLPEPLARIILQCDLEQCAARLIRLLGNETWRAMDGESKLGVVGYIEKLPNVIAGRIIPTYTRDEVLAASPRQIVLLDWCLNTGGGSMPGFLAAVKAADWQRAHDELIFRKVGEPAESAYYKVRPERAALNAKVILTGEWPT